MLLHGNELHAVTLSLSMAAKLGANLRDVVGRALLEQLAPLNMWAEAWATRGED